ncbi:MAG: aldehyde dehydrogenase family protein [Phycisphaerales bacterium]|nr:aldehyde dehydrogenase family protein [Phycisphaerales bacterium]
MTSWHPSLKHGPADLVGGSWRALEAGRSAGAVESRQPARNEEVVWRGTPRETHIDHAVAAARAALPAWSGWPVERRAAVLKRYQQVCAARLDAVAALIRDEVGKPMWDAKAEASLLAAKVDITLDATPPYGPLARVSGYELNLGGTKTGRAWFRPHGVMAVLGPFNFPAHLPNGHIVPALLMGNTVVLKPSDKAPAVGQLLGELFLEALEAEGAPAGVVNVVQGGAAIAAKLVAHDGVDGVLFTGSWPVGRRIMEANLDRPGRILALEMGGNNAAVILPDADLKQAVIECVRCAFIGTGQRCTCTRRVIVHEAAAGKVIPAICKAASNLIIGDPRSDGPVFMGPLISESARDAILDSQSRLHAAGGELLMPMRPLDLPPGSSDSVMSRGWYVTPGVMRVDRFTLEEDAGCGADIEVFGPFLRIAVVRSLDEAIEQANATRYGLAASIFTKDRAAIERFLHEARAGCVNVNTGTAGASSKLPFGGLGLSGNHRPAGAFSLDYCAYPVAGMIESGEASTISPGMRFEDAWLK